MDIKMKLRDFVVDNEGEYILKNCKEGDRWSKIMTKDMEIKSMSPSGLTISLVDEQDQMIMVLLPNDDKILINAEECPIGESFLGERKVLYERTSVEKWNDTLSPGHFYLVFDNLNQIKGVIFLRWLQDSFLEWEEFRVRTGEDSWYTVPKITKQTIEQLEDCKFIPLYGIGLNLNEE